MQKLAPNNRHTVHTPISESLAKRHAAAFSLLMSEQWNGEWGTKEQFNNLTIKQ